MTLEFVSNPLPNCPVCGVLVYTLVCEPVYALLREHEGVLGPDTMAGLPPLIVGDKTERIFELDVMRLQPCGCNFQRFQQSDWLERTAKRRLP